MDSTVVIWDRAAAICYIIKDWFYVGITRPTTKRMATLDTHTSEDSSDTLWSSVSHWDLCTCGVLCINNYTVTTWLCTFNSLLWSSQCCWFNFLSCSNSDIFSVNLLTSTAHPERANCTVWWPFCLHCSTRVINYSHFWVSQLNWITGLLAFTHAFIILLTTN